MIKTKTKYLMLLLVLITNLAIGQKHLEQHEVFNESGFIRDTTLKIPDTKKRTDLNLLLYNNDRVESVPIDLSKVERILVAGTENRPLQMTFVCDAYQDRALAISTSLDGFNFLMSKPPYNRHPELYKCVVGYIRSPHLGCKHPGTAIDCSSANPQVPIMDSVTTFGATLDYGGTHRLLVCTDNANLSLVFAYLQAQQGMMIVNVGITWYGGSGGTYATYAGLNPASKDILYHELGHSYFGLADEYGGSNSTCAERPNVTGKTTRITCPWGGQILPTTTIPTTFTGDKLLIGIYMPAGMSPNCASKYPYCEMRYLYNDLSPDCVERGDSIQLARAAAIGNPAITVNANGATYCKGGSGIMSASGATTYSWQPSTGLSATTGANVTVNVTTTTTYTVTGYTGTSSGTKIVVATVNPLPVLTPVNATLPPVNLSVSGASTYNWNPSTNLSSTTGSIVTYNSSATYTVVGTSSLGCTASTTITISPQAQVANAPYRSQWISMSTGSSTWKAGETRQVTVTVRNNGTATWADLTPNGVSGDINLGVKWNNDSDFPVPLRVNAGNLVSGATKTYTFNLTAPMTTGTNNISFNVVREVICWFQNCDSNNTIYVSGTVTIVP